MVVSPDWEMCLMTIAVCPIKVGHFALHGFFAVYCPAFGWTLKLATPPVYIATSQPGQ